VLLEAARQGEENNQMEQSQSNESATFPILVFHHEAEDALFKELRPHLELLEQCLPTTSWRYYTLPLDLDEAQLPRFQERVVQSRFWVLCTSAGCIGAFLSMCQQFPFVSAAFSQVSVSLPLRACTYDATLLQTPLAAVEPGHNRDQRCAQMALTLESALRKHTNLARNPWIEQLLDAAIHQREG
jgi:hypothetical protein